MTGSTAIFWPMIVQALLTFSIYGLASRRRIAAVKSGKAKADDYRVPISEPEHSATAIRNLENQFELPVLFFAVCLALYLTAGAGLVAVVLAWIFALSRLMHAYVHVTSNRLRYRRPLFMVGFAAAFLMWLLFAYHLVTA